MIDRLKSAIFEGGPIKTPAVAASGFFTWSALKGMLEATVLIGTALLVMIHLYNALVKQFCRKRYSGTCVNCPLRKTPFCSVDTEKDDL